MRTGGNDIQDEGTTRARQRGRKAQNVFEFGQRSDCRRDSEGKKGFKICLSLWDRGSSTSE